jgi:type III secretion control protein HpaP
MTAIDSRALRIIPGDMPGTAPLTPRARRLDYAALARRRFLPPADSQSDDTLAPATARDAQPAAPNVLQSFLLADLGSPVAPAGTDSQPAAPDRGLVEQICYAAQPIVNEVFRSQGDVLELATSLARHIAAFCGDDAINKAGTWEAQLPLDESILPRTSLHLSLSRHKLSLRFDTPEIDSRQLLLNHSAILENELSAQLSAWGHPRDIELTVF